MRRAVALQPQRAAAAWTWTWTWTGRRTMATKTRKAAVATATTATPTEEGGEWTKRMSEERWELLRRVVEAPSPVNLEAAMTFGVVEPAIRDVAKRAGLDKKWKVHRFVGSAGLVVDTMPPETSPTKPKLTVMAIGHADKIRMMVRSVDPASGKVYIDSDSFLPTSLLAQDVSIYSEDPKNHASFRRVRGTVEAVGAIHFADAGLRSGSKGITPEMLYVDLGTSGKDGGARVKELGIKPGDPVLVDRPIRRTVADHGVSGAYLDNGLGCFIVTDLARLLVSPRHRDALESVRVLLTIATHEEIGRLGSRVLASRFEPDVVFGVDVNHDYVNAPGVGAKRYPPISLGKGFTVSVGAIASRKLNEFVLRAAARRNIPVQLDAVGRDTGTDAMAGVLGNIDAAATSLGIPLRNMHTASETGLTTDVDACLHGLAETISLLAEEGVTREKLIDGHVDLSHAELVTSLPPAPVGDKGDKAVKDGVRGE